MFRSPFARPAVIEILAVALALVALHPLLSPGHQWGHDTGAHLFRLAEVARGLGEGILYPRFLPDAYGGLGGPILTFNPVAPYYLPALLVLIGLGPIAALKVAAGLVSLAGGFAMRMLARPHLGRIGAAVAGLAWIYFPYRIADLYVRMAYPELAVMVVLPLAMAAGRRAALRPSPRRTAVGALLLGALPATHFPGSVLGLPLAAAWSLLPARRGRRLQAARVFAIMALLGLAASSFSWLPALAEIGDTHYLESSRGVDNYRHHFVSMGQLVSPAWGFGSSMPGSSDRMSFQIGWVHLLALGAVTGAAVRLLPLRPLVSFCVGVAAAGTFLMLPVSRPLWAVTPVLQNVQFPWRALMLTGIATSLACGLTAILPAVSRRRASGKGRGGPAAAGRGGRLAARRHRGSRAARVLPVLVMALLAGACLPYLQARSGRGVDADFTPEAFRGRYFGELKFQPSEVATPRFVPSGPRALLLAGGPARIVSESTHRMKVEIDPVSATTLRLHLFASPGWKARVDGEPARVRMEPGTGLVLVDVPAGVRVVELRYGATPAGLVGRWLSIAALLAAALMTWRAR